MRKATGEQRQRRRVLGPALIRYRSPVSKDELTFGQVLARSIDLWFESDSDFARQAGVSSSAVSRWRTGDQIPRPDTIERMAPHVYDERRKPITATRLLVLAYPALAGTATVKPVEAAMVHPIARDVMWMLADDSPVPQDKREALANLLETVVAPYRTYRRKRKSA
jgi:transcriptional regulator with XRE-family HTH domain